MSQQEKSRALVGGARKSGGSGKPFGSFREKGVARNDFMRTAGSSKISFKLGPRVGFGQNRKIGPEEGFE